MWSSSGAPPCWIAVSPRRSHIIAASTLFSSIVTGFHMQSVSSRVKMDTGPFEKPQKLQIDIELTIPVFPGATFVLMEKKTVLRSTGVKQEITQLKVMQTPAKWHLVVCYKVLTLETNGCSHTVLLVRVLCNLPLVQPHTHTHSDVLCRPDLREQFGVQCVSKRLFNRGRGGADQTAVPTCSASRNGFQPHV